MEKEVTNEQTFIVRHAALFDRFFSQTDVIAVVVLNRDLQITEYNPCFKKMIDCRIDCSGKNINTFLASASQAILPLPSDSKYLSINLHFLSVTDTSVLWASQIYKTADGGYLILGESPGNSERHIVSKMTLLANEMANMTRDLHRKNKELEEAYAKIKVLSGIIPICMYCKKIRDDQGYWDKIENFITEHSEAHFSHGICDSCLERYFPEDTE